MSLDPIQHLALVLSIVLALASISALRVRQTQESSRPLFVLLVFVALSLWEAAAFVGAGKAMLTASPKILHVSVANQKKPLLVTKTSLKALGLPYQVKQRAFEIHLRSKKGTVLIIDTKGKVPQTRSLDGSIKAFGDTVAIKAVRFQFSLQSLVEPRMMQAFEEFPFIFALLMLFIGLFFWIVHGTLGYFPAFFALSVQAAYALSALAHLDLALGKHPARLINIELLHISLNTFHFLKYRLLPFFLCLVAFVIFLRRIRLSALIFLLCAPFQSKVFAKHGTLLATSFYRPFLVVSNHLSYMYTFALSGLFLVLIHGTERGFKGSMTSLLLTPLFIIYISSLFEAAHDYSSSKALETAQTTVAFLLPVGCLLGFYLIKDTSPLLILGSILLIDFVFVSIRFQKSTKWTLFSAMIVFFGVLIFRKTNAEDRDVTRLQAARTPFTSSVDQRIQTILFIAKEGTKNCSSFSAKNSCVTGRYQRSPPFSSRWDSLKAFAIKWRFFFLFMLGFDLMIVFMLYQMLLSEGFYKKTDDDLLYSHSLFQRLRLLREIFLFNLFLYSSAALIIAYYSALVGPIMGLNFLVSGSQSNMILYVILFFIAHLLQKTQEMGSKKDENI